MAAHRAFLDGLPIATVRGDEVPAGQKTTDLVEWAAKHFESKAGSAVERADIGRVVIDKVSAKNTLGHGRSRNKELALYLVPEIIGKGRLILSEPSPTKPGMTGHFIGAPVEIGGRAMVAMAVVRSDANMQRMYVHEVTLKEVLPRSTAINTGADAGAGTRTRTDGAGASSNLLDRVFSVDPTSVSKVTDADGKPLVAYHGLPSTGISAFNTKADSIKARTGPPGTHSTDDPRAALQLQQRQGAAARRQPTSACRTCSTSRPPSPSRRRAAACRSGRRRRRRWRSWTEPSMMASCSAAMA